MQLHDFAAIGATILLGEIMGYFGRKQQKKKLELIGSKSTEVLFFDGGRIKPLEYILYAFGGLIIASGIILGLTGNKGFGILQPVSYGMSLLYLPAKWKESRKLVIGEHGLFNSAFVLKWEQISQIVWDKDINQQSWGLKIFKKGSIVAEKMYVKRKYKVEIQQKINEYFSRYTINKYFESQNPEIIKAIHFEIDT